MFVQLQHTVILHVCSLVSAYQQHVLTVLSLFLCNSGSPWQSDRSYFSVQCFWIVCKKKKIESSASYLDGNEVKYAQCCTHTHTQVMHRAAFHSFFSAVFQLILHKISRPAENNQEWLQGSAVSRESHGRIRHGDRQLEQNSRPETRGKLEGRAETGLFKPTTS